MGLTEKTVKSLGLTEKTVKSFIGLKSCYPLWLGAS